MSTKTYPVSIKIAAVAVVSILTFALLEIGLRLQPFVPLSYSELMRTPELRVSYEHHHNVLHIPQVQRASLGSGCNGPGKRFKILFMGDSWMELVDGIPKGAAESLLENATDDLCIDIVNGGTTSFSPSLMLVKGESLIREHSPDFVVVNIDETDLMDEYLRYRKTTLRDWAGRIERVVPNVADLAFVYQRAVLAQQPVYTLRLLEQIYYDEVLLPRLRRTYHGVETQIGAYELIMSPQVSQDPRTTHAREVQYFRQVLREMTERLAAKLPPNRLLLTHHPHLKHLPQGKGAAGYNSIVADIVAEEVRTMLLAKPASVGFYSAVDDAKKMYGDKPETYFVAGDLFSHLTPDGYRLYGRQIGLAVLALMAGKLQP